MKEGFRILAITASVFALALSSNRCASAPTATATTPPAKTPVKPAATRTTRVAATTAAFSKTDCLECHSFDDVIEATANYVMPSGERHSPHRYLDPNKADTPHDSTGVESVPECRNCHTAHPLPPTDAVDLSKVGVWWCYSTCHHQNNFTPCSECHKREGTLGATLPR